jgi:hypothetical protein
VSLHTDGYANDPNPTTDKRGVLAAVKKLADKPGVLVNTVAYNNSDFQFLMEVANLGRGRYVRVTTPAQLYRELHDTSTLLRNGTVDAMEIHRGTADMLVAIIPQDNKIVFSGAPDKFLLLDGLSESSLKNGVVHSYHIYPELVTDDSVPELTNHSAVWGFIRANIAKGDLTTAKYALVSTKRNNLVEQHIRALTAEQISAFVDTTEMYLGFSHDNPVAFTDSESPTYGITRSGSSIKNILGILALHKSGFRLCMDDIWANYKRRGLKVVEGTYDHVLNL